MPPHPYRPRRLTLPTAIVKKSRVIVQFALLNSSLKRRILYGVVLRVEITCTRTALSSGPRAKLGKRFDVFIGEIVLDAVETLLLMISSRTPWQGDEESLKRVKKTGKINDEGYVNVAGELGLSGARDCTTYHQPWVRRQGLGYY